MLQKEILIDVVGTSGYRCGVLQPFPVERIEQDGVWWKRHHIVSFGGLNDVLVAFMARPIPLKNTGQFHFAMELTEPGYSVVFDESNPEPAKRQTGSRRKSKNKVSIFVDDNIIPEPDVALELGKSISLAEAEEEEVIRHVHTTHESANTIQALKAIKKSSRSQPYTGGSSEGAGVTPEVPDESTAILITSSEGTGSKEESEYSDEENVNEEVEWLTTDEEEERKDNDEDDRSIDIEKTNDDEETDDEFVHGDEYVHDDVDKEMKDAEVVDTGKDDEEITNAEKVDVEKTKEVKGNNKKDELPLTSSSLSDIIDAKINSLLDIQIQQDVPHIQSPSILIIQKMNIKFRGGLLGLKRLQGFLLLLRSHVLAAVDKYLGSCLRDVLQKVLQKHTKELIQQSSKKYASEIIKIKQEQAAKEKMPKFLATPYDQAVEAEFTHKEIVFKMMRESKSYKKHLKHKELYDALMLSLIPDEDDLDRVVPDLRKRDREEDEDPSARSNKGKRKISSRKDSELSKKPLASKKTSKGDAPPKSSKTGKSESAKESVEEATHKPWLNDLLSVKKDPLTFDEPIATPIDFSKFVMDRLKINKLTKAYLVGPVYNLLKGTCQSNIELEYNIEECYKALSNQLDWNNPEGDHCPFDLSKPLPLKGRPGHLTVALEYFFNNDLVYLKSSDPKKKYNTSITKIKAENFVNAHLNDIEDMLLLFFTQAIHSCGAVIVDLAIYVMFTRSSHSIKERVEDVQLGVESYQRSSTSPSTQKDFLGILPKKLCTHHLTPGVIYEDLSSWKRLMAS
ncbi:hypothetical protein Tco_0167571 [Tanacetum coccineum]